MIYYKDTLLIIDVVFSSQVVKSNMAFGLYSLLEAALLCLNAVCVLHEERFLAKSRYLDR